jgi:hypothetical protein
LVGLVEAQDVRYLVFLLGVGDVVGPPFGAPLLVGVEQGNIFKVDRLAINNGLPVVHPGDFGRSSEAVCPLRTRDTVMLFGESKTTLASTTGLERSGLNESGKTTEGQKEGRGKHNE